MQNLLSEPSSVSTKPKISPFEELIGKVGGRGKYQKRSFLIFCLMWFLTACLLLGMNFFFDDAFTCKDPSLSNPSKCQKYVCSLPIEARPEEIQTHAPSIIFEFDTFLICQEHSNTVSLLEDMMFLGSLLGFFIIPFIADNFGTRLALRIAWGTGTVSVFIACISPNPYVLAFALFFVGFGVNPSITLCFSIINETCLGRTRQRYAVGIQIAWAVGEIAIALIFLSSISWKGVMYIIFVFFVGCYLAVEFMIYESPMFLLKKQPRKALLILNKIAAVNLKQPIPISQVNKIIDRQSSLSQGQKESSLGFTDLFRYKSIRMTSISAGIIFFGVQVIYYSSVLGVDTIGFSKNINQVVFGVSQMLGYVVCELIVDMISRKRATYIGMGLTSLFCLTMGIMVMLETQENQHILSWFQVVLLILTSFSVCCFESIIYVYAAELYPTEIRSIGFGWVSLVGIMGSIVAPFAKTIAASVSLNSWFVPASLGLMAWVFSICLPETHGQPLQDRIEERSVSLMEGDEKSEKQKGDSESTVTGRGSERELKSPLIQSELVKVAKISIEEL